MSVLKLQTIGKNVDCKTCKKVAVWDVDVVNGVKGKSIQYESLGLAYFFQKMLSVSFWNERMILVILTPYHNKSARLFALDSETLHTNISEIIK